MDMLVLYLNLGAQTLNRSMSDTRFGGELEELRPPEDAQGEDWSVRGMRMGKCG